MMEATYMTTDTRVDNYISNSADFAKPILSHLRTLVHHACPTAEETIKWSFPHFQYAGSILCSMASFKQHCAFTFWLRPLMKDPNKVLLAGDEKTAMGHLGQIKSLEDLPADSILKAYIKEAMLLIDDGAKLPKKGRGPVKELEIPAYFLKALKHDKKASSIFEKFNTSQKREYVEWLTEAKTEDTGNKRLSTAIEWIAEGKSRMWKYKK